MALKEILFFLRNSEHAQLPVIDYCANEPDQIIVGIDGRRCDSEMPPPVAALDGLDCKITMPLKMLQEQGATECTNLVIRDIVEHSSHDGQKRPFDVRELKAARNEEVVAENRVGALFR